MVIKHTHCPLNYASTVCYTDSTKLDFTFTFKYIFDSNEMKKRKKHRIRPFVIEVKR